jgi:hypothetical protein
MAYKASKYIQNNLFYVIDKKIIAKNKNSKYYCIKFLLVLLVDNNEMVKQFYKKYGKSQLLFSFFAGTLINNMFHINENVAPSYRELIMRTGWWDYKKICHWE